jgi:predicted ATPase
MLSAIDLKLFKCFESLALPLGPLTLLSGPNSSGKSSILQSLVLLHQTMSEHEWSTRLLLNGRTVRLGTVSDVVDQVNGRRSFQIGIDRGSTSIFWSFSGDRAEMSMGVDSVRFDGDERLEPNSLHYLVPDGAAQESRQLVDSLRRANYITAERIGPRESYPLEDLETASVVGPAGEHAASVLFWGRDGTVEPHLCIDDTPATLLRQVEARMRIFFPGCGVELQKIPGVNAVTLGLRTSDDTDFHSPANVGFGLTQLLPIVVAALSSRPGDLLLIENPEVHLHPAAQSMIGRFLAAIASVGIQVIVESHSDHVLNGIRRAVNVGQITPDDVVLHYFRSRHDEAPQVSTPSMNPDGSVDFWPAGFFDQFDEDVSFLAGWGSNATTPE